VPALKQGQPDYSPVPDVDEGGVTGALYVGALLLLCGPVGPTGLLCVVGAGGGGRWNWNCGCPPEVGPCDGTPPPFAVGAVERTDDRVFDGDCTALVARLAACAASALASVDGSAAAAAPSTDGERAVSGVAGACAVAAGALAAFASAALAALGALACALLLPRRSPSISASK
jgi:hypothetical protein